MTPTGLPTSRRSESPKATGLDLRNWGPGLYQRLPRLLHDLEIAKGDGRYRTMLAALQRIDLLILNDWRVTPLTNANRRDLLEVLDVRYGTRSTLITS